MHRPKLMSLIWASMIGLVTMGLSLPCVAAAPQKPELSELAGLAVGNDAEAAQRAVAQLRAVGPAGLEALIEANAAAVERHRGGAVIGGDDANWSRIAAAIDAVAAQKDAWASGLYWYTDLDAAKQAARESGKPILSLRLLGRLDAEFSCANSRFFRTVLYANADVSKTLREQYILHWKSVRPVPKVTIDFGDGRVVERTITGNSIHYVLDADGKVMDALPGLYGPHAFLKCLADVQKHTQYASGLAGRDQGLKAWHADCAQQELAQWQADLQRVGVTLVTMGAATINLTSASATSVSLAQGNVIAAQGSVTLNAAPPTAQAAAPLAISKGTVEMPMVAAIAPNARAAAPLAISKSYVEKPLVTAITPTAQAAAPLAASKFDVEGAWVAAITFNDKDLETATTGEIWTKIAALHVDEERLDARSKALMAAKNPTASHSSPAAMANGKVQAPFAKMVDSFERSVAQDTVRDEYTFHRQIHLWLAAGKLPDGKEATDVDALNERVYADLFLTPSSDPWLGLMPADAYSALADDGVCAKK